MSRMNVADAIRIIEDEIAITPIDDTDYCKGYVQALRRMLCLIREKRAELMDKPFERTTKAVEE